MKDFVLRVLAMFLAICVYEALNRLYWRFLTGERKTNLRLLNEMYEHPERFTDENDSSK
jgi:hypothetical protein